MLGPAHSLHTENGLNRRTNLGPGEMKQPRSLQNVSRVWFSNLLMGFHIRSLLGVQVHVIDGVTNGGLTMIQNLSDAINKYQYLKCWTQKGLRFRNQDPAIRHRRGFQVSESILVPWALNC